MNPGLLCRAGNRACSRFSGGFLIVLESRLEPRLAALQRLVADPSLPWRTIAGRLFHGHYQAAQMAAAG